MEVRDGLALEGGEPLRASDEGVAALLEPVELEIELEPVAPALRAARRSTKSESIATRTPLVFKYTRLIPRSKQVAIIRSMCGWVVGSPPGSCTMSASRLPRARRRVSFSSNSSKGICHASWGPEPAKHVGHARLQRAVTSKISVKEWLRAQLPFDPSGRALQ